MAKILWCPPVLLLLYHIGTYSLVLHVRSVKYKFKKGMGKACKEPIYKHLNNTKKIYGR